MIELWLGIVPSNGEYMKHHTIELQRKLELKGYEFYQFGKDGISVYYFTPKNQLLRLEDADCIAIELFMK